ncbi:sugar phosphate isomerase/epimerase family protein [Spirochaeta isovalerica]|uniref:Sugar phosphate isomerase/epimerase n=1 Tax=Spirochaeta isovalerica TaxID=150 RepID=A0A841RAL9_9SPIO|nr:sugar phosphate isomerase/epimerase [Spirochaeta isovalerica]MBB6479969.1 sugar phosphate isomerase/epimerase [Spirochaeta isovalerica]
MNIGIRAHDLGRFSSAGELAEAVLEAGLDSIQLVPWKAFSHVERSPGLWSPCLIEEIQSNLVGRGISISLVGAYFNWFSREEIRGGGIGRRIFRESLAVLSALGADAVGTETEGFSILPFINSPKNLSEEAMEQAVAVLRDLQNTACLTDSYIAVEGVSFHVLSSPERVVELKERSGADRLKFIFDPVNFLTIKNWRHQDELIERTVDLYGDDLLLIHCKDFIPTPAGLLPAAPGEGRFNYRLLYKKLKEAGKSGVPFILEGVRGGKIRSSRDFLMSLAK